MTTQPAPDKNYCSNCGHPNPLWAVACEKCFKRLTPVDGVDFSKLKVMRSRPGCITAYAILLFISAGLAVLGGAAFVIMTIELRSPSSPLAQSGLGSQPWWGFISTFALAASVISVGFNLFMGWGLWNLKNWARILVIVLTSLGALGSLGSLVSLVAMTVLNPSNNHANPMATLVSSLINLVIAGIIIFWFSTNGDYFH